MNRRPKRSVAPAPAPEEAAAIVAAIELFMRGSAPPPASEAPAPSPWARAGLLEGCGHAPGELPPW